MSWTVPCCILKSLPTLKNIHTASNKKKFWTSARPAPRHSALSCVLLSTINSAEGFLCLDPLGLLVSPWTPPLLLSEPLLLLRRVLWVFSALWGILVIAVLLLCSPLALPSLDFTFPAFGFLDLLSFGLLSEDFFFCGILLGRGGVSDGGGWMVGGLILVCSSVRLVCSVVWLLMTTSVRKSSSVCSLAKLTNTYKNEPVSVLVFNSFSHLSCPCC